MNVMHTSPYTCKYRQAQKSRVKSSSEGDVLKFQSLKSSTENIELDIMSQEVILKDRKTAANFRLLAHTTLLTVVLWGVVT